MTRKIRVSGFSRWADVVSGVECYHCRMKPTQLLRAILPDVLIDNFEVDHFEKSDTCFDIWLDEKILCNFYCTFLCPRSFNILRRLGIGAKRKASENQ